MEHTQSDLAVEIREVPRCFPAILGALLAVAGVVYAESLASWCFGRHSQPALLLELPLLLAGGAITGHLAQYATEGCKLRLGRIVLAVVTFDLVLAAVFCMLAR